MFLEETKRFKQNATTNWKESKITSTQLIIILEAQSITAINLKHGQKVDLWSKPIVITFFGGFEKKTSLKYHENIIILTLFHQLPFFGRRKNKTNYFIVHTCKPYPVLVTIWCEFSVGKISTFHSLRLLSHLLLLIQTHYQSNFSVAFTHKFHHISTHLSKSLSFKSGLSNRNHNRNSKVFPLIFTHSCLIVYFAKWQIVTLKSGLLEVCLNLSNCQLSKLSKADLRSAKYTFQSAHLFASVNSASFHHHKSSPRCCISTFY